MGVMSRKILPACGNLCFFCPSMRARSRQPVKRYKKLLGEIFPRSQNAEPNDRKIGKLCEYASKNPLRIPKITEYLDQRFYKDLRNQHFGSVRVVLCIYRQLLSSCQEQMPLFASSLLGIIRTLLEQTGQDEMRILGCNALVDFINTQTDSTCMFNLEGLIPKLCQLAQEVGDGERTLRFRAAGLRSLAFMVWFMGEHSHVSLDFDNIISVILENYEDLPQNAENPRRGLMEEENNSSLPEVNKKVPSTLNIVSFKPKLDPKEGTSENPAYWSRICLQNMARLAKEATTVRRVLEPLFQCFDSDSHWSSESGLACSILTYMQMLLEESGLSAHLLLSILIKHLDHRGISRQPAKQINIVKVAIKIAENAKKGVSVAITGAVADLIKHLRKCMQHSGETSNSVNGLNDCYKDFQSALESCIRQLSIKVGDLEPILDMMAVALESLPTNATVARMTLASVYRTIEIVSSTPNVSYHQKTFPDALFHQLLVAMAHLDHETRVLSHRTFSLVLMPSVICEQSYSFKHAAVNKEAEQNTLRLSSHQVSLLLSAIWMQAVSTVNTPENFEAMVHTFNNALLFTRYKNSGQKMLVRCFQLAFSLREISLDSEALPPSSKRSLFTMATSMLFFSAKAGNVPELLPVVKSLFIIDPYLELVEDTRLVAVYSGEGAAYRSQEDEVAALNSLSTIESGNEQLRETVLSHLIAKFSDLSEDELLDIRKQLLEGFSADDLYPMGAPLFMETPRGSPPLAKTESHLFDEIMAEEGLTDEEAFSEPNGSQSDRKTSSSFTSLDVLSVNQLLESVLETARHVANLPVSSTPIPYDQVKNECEALVTGKQQKMSVLQSFKTQQGCKAIVLSEEQEEINSTLSNVTIEVSEEDLQLINIDQVVAGEDKHLLSCSLQCAQQESFRLPPSSPYDKFMKAAGC